MRGSDQAARPTAATRRTSTGATADQPLPPPASVTSVLVNEASRQRSSQSPAPDPGSASGSASVAPTIESTEGAASAAVVRGAARSAAATPSARNGSVAIRNRGPGTQPPNGR